jgi:hypothetical protein
MEKTFTSRALRKYAVDMTERLGGVAATAQAIGCDQSSLSKFLLGHLVTNTKLFRALGVRFDRHRGLYVQDDESAERGAVEVNLALADENRCLREQIKGMRISRRKPGVLVDQEAA